MEEVLGTVPAEPCLWRHLGTAVCTAPVLHAKVVNTTAVSVALKTTLVFDMQFRMLSLHAPTRESIQHDSSSNGCPARQRMLTL